MVRSKGASPRRALLVSCLLLCGCATTPGGFATDEDMAIVEDLAVRPEVDLRPPTDLGAGADLRPMTGCTIVPQGGCPAGQKCTTHDSSTSICDPAGPSARGQACTVATGIDSCAAGSVCIDEGGGRSQCRAFCKSDGDCKDIRSYCSFTLGTGTYKLCTQPCNAIYPGAGCAAGLGCFALNLDLFLLQERTDCGAPGPRSEGQACASARDCQGGMGCIGPAGAGLCRRICRRGDSAVCAAGTTCGDIPGFIPWPNYGACCPGGTC